MLDYENNEFVFSCGKRIYANCRVIGLSYCEQERYGRLSYGYDGGIFEDKLDVNEKIELANYMITLWTDYRNSKL